MRSDDPELRSLQNVFRSWAHADVQKALAGARSLQDPRSKALAMRSILLVRADLPQAQRAAIAAEYHIDLLDDGFSPSPNIKTPADAERFWREALAVADSPERNQRLSQIAYLWGKLSPQAALQAIAQMEDVELRTRFLYEALRAWSEESPREAYAWVAGATLHPSERS